MMVCKKFPQILVSYWLLFLIFWSTQFKNIFNMFFCNKEMNMLIYIFLHITNFNH